MTTSANHEADAAMTNNLEAVIADRLSAADRKLLQATPVKGWPKLRIVSVVCQEAGELVELVPEMNRVMKICPAMILARGHRGEIPQTQGTEGYAQLHDAVNNVRNALNTMLYLAGFRVPASAAGKTAPPTFSSGTPVPPPPKGTVTALRIPPT